MRRAALAFGFVAAFLGIVDPARAEAQARPAYLDVPATIRMVGSAAEGEKVPLFVVLPPTGGDAEGVFESLRPSIPLSSYAVLLPAGAPSSSEYLPNFAAFSRAYEERVVTDLRDALATRPIDPERVFVVGFSLGGDLSCVFLAHHPELFRGGFVIASRCSASPSSSARATLSTRDARVFFAIGSSDDASRVSGITRAYERLLAAHVTTRLDRYEGSHQLPRDRALPRAAFAFLLAPRAESTPH